MFPAKYLKGYCKKICSDFSLKIVEHCTANQALLLIIRLADSCANQLLLIIHEIYKSFDDYETFWSVFLSICKAFRELFPICPFFKLKQNDISGNLLTVNIHRPILKEAYYIYFLCIYIYIFIYLFVFYLFILYFFWVSP